MALSFGRTLYNLTTRREADAPAARPARPAGEVLWLHAATEAAGRRMTQLAARLIEDLGVSILMTASFGTDAQHGSGPSGMINQPPPPDFAADTKAFLDYWRPDIIVFSDGEIRPEMLHLADERRIPSLLVDAREPYFIKEREGWYPGLMRSCLMTLRHVMAIDEAAVKSLRKAGAISVDLAGRMEEASAVLPYNEPERAALASLMHSRPVWLAAAVPKSEEAAVIAAHKSAIALSHRLLLILVPEDPQRAGPLAAELEQDHAWMVAQRNREETPEAEIEIFIPEDDAEMGLWYRLAPVTFLGGSLLGAGCNRNPMEAAALGSAIVFGQKSGRFGNVFGRLGAAVAARAIASPFDLAEALSDLLSPERAAKLAQSAWNVASEGADVTEQVCERIRRILDGNG
jgi:3-deoxy-D-manno-octulosonic-acid transferase